MGATTVRISAGAASLGTAAAGTPGKPSADQADAFMALLASAGEDVIAATGFAEEKPLRESSIEEEGEAASLLFPTFLQALPEEAEAEAQQEGLDAGLAGGSGQSGPDALLQMLESFGEGSAEGASVTDPIAQVAADAALQDAAAFDVAMAAADPALNPDAGDAPAQDLRQVLQAMTLATRESTAESRAPAPLATVDASGTTPSSTLSPQTQPAQAAAPAGAVEHAVRTAVGTPRWADEVGSRLLLMTARGQQEGSLTLTPEDLGPMEVRISMTQNTANVWFGAQQAETRAALTEAIPRLREMFAEAGLSLGHTGVSQEAPRQQTAQPLRGEFPAGDERGGSAAPEQRATVRGVTSALLDVYA